MREVVVRGAAMTRFGRQLDRSARALAQEALAGALVDADLDARDVQAAFVANAVGGLISGQEASRAQVVLRGTGLMGVPMMCVENACASSSTALHLAWRAVASGAHDCVVVLGYEKVCHQDRARSFRAMNAVMDLTDLVDVFGVEAGDERSVFMDLYGAVSNGGGRDMFASDALALVSVKNHRHGCLNPNCQLARELTPEQVLASRRVAGSLTSLMCAPLSDGAACLVLSPLEFPRGRPGRVRIAASILVSGRGDDLLQPIAVRRATGKACEAAGVGIAEVDVVELQDGSSVAELQLYEELGLCESGAAEELVRSGATWLGGRVPVNPSGGLISRGHPIGATGAAQVVELVWQLEGRCGDRQVPGARVGLAQNAGGWVGTDVAACCVHVLQA